MVLYDSVVKSTGGVALVPRPDLPAGGSFAPVVPAPGDAISGIVGVDTTATFGNVPVQATTAGQNCLCVFNCPIAGVGSVAGGQGLIYFELELDGAPLTPSVEVWSGLVPDPVSQPAWQATISWAITVELPDTLLHTLRVRVTTDDANCAVGAFGVEGNLNAWMQS